MNQKDFIKYALLIFGGYLIYKYVQDHGGLEGIFGTVTAAAPGQHPAVTAPAGATTPGATAPTPPPPQAPPPPRTIEPVAPLLDLTGLVVVPDVNDSLTGTVKINGIPVRLSIITADGRIFDSSGAEVTDSMTQRGIDVVALRTAFIQAGQGLSGLGRLGGWAPAWLM